LEECSPGVGLLPVFHLDVVPDEANDVRFVIATPGLPPAPNVIGQLGEDLADLGRRGPLAPFAFVSTQPAAHVTTLGST
jgi:hypothetical protein